MDLHSMEGKTIFLTGATGLIGRNIISYIQNANQALQSPIHVIGLTRDETKVSRMFPDRNNLSFVTGDVRKRMEVNESIDYIIHAASETSSKSFISQPLHTIHTSIDGTFNVLTLAKEKNIESMVFLSTMEVYGTPDNDEKIPESHGTNLDTMDVRSCYPESKRLCENICASFCKEHGVPVKVLRLTQTFGKNVEYNDSRVFAEFARCVVEHRDIVLHTKGDTKRSYLYTEDAVEAILTTLLAGENGKAYNAANEDTYCSILEMAELVCHEIAKDSIRVVIQEDDPKKFGYASTLKMNLDTTALQKIGWNPKTTLQESFQNMLDDWKKRS